MSSIFEIKEHTIECQHIRQFPRATLVSQEDVLHLAIKQYIPLDNQDPKDGDITIIGACANGFPKELYEPLWEDIYARSKSNGFRIRGIWIADTAMQGASGILNEQLLGNDPSWSDHARDLLHMTNVFRSQMPMPIVGIGHSYGANILTNLAFIHPRLFTTVILLDPVIQFHASSPSGPSPARASTYRRDYWPSHAEAEASFRKSKFYQTWDPRVLDRWCQYGIRKTPTPLYTQEQGVTLSTTKYQECFTFLRPSWDAVSEDGKTIIKRELVPDMPSDSPVKYPFYRAEPMNTLLRLGELRPSAFYIFGSKSDMSDPEAVKYKLDVTGTGTGGSGGAKEGKVDGIVLEGIGHLVAMEASEKCADAAAKWFGKAIKVFEKEREEYLEWTKQSFEARTTFPKDWFEYMGTPYKSAKRSKM